MSFMTSTPRLGGFRILKSIVEISVIFPRNPALSPSRLFRLITEQKINLPYLTCIYDSQAWGLNITVEPLNQRKLARAIKRHPAVVFSVSPGRSILSIFPHKKSLDITGSLLEVFNQQGLEFDALANSPSAMSIILKEKLVSRASNALFEPFTFSSYRTPADWKLAQKGKEHLYKEVVASYQEKKPKVYGLLCYEGQDMKQVKLEKNKVSAFGTTLRKLSHLGLSLTFMATGPCQEAGKEMLVFCLSTSKGLAKDLIPPGFTIQNVSPVAVFSMNGPHFGDRYGIASEVLTALENKGVNLLALSCTIASVTGVVPFHQLKSTIDAIQGCFEVPSVIKKD